MSKCTNLENYESVCEKIELSLQEYSNNYANFIEDFDKYDIRLTASRRYFYNGKFKTKNRAKGSNVFYKIHIFPKEYTFEQAKKKHLSKEFFSHKIIDFKKIGNSYKIKTYSSKDKILQKLLAKYLRKCKVFEQNGKKPKMALKENLADVFRTFFLMARYRTEVKTEFYGFDLHWIILVIAAILIFLSVHAHYEVILN